MKRKMALLIGLLLTLSLSGCSGEGGGFDIVKFLQNPIVMVIGGIIIVIYMMKRSK